MENEVKRKLDFLCKIGSKVQDELIRENELSKRAIFVFPVLPIFMIIATEYTSKTCVAEYFGVEESIVDSYIDAKSYDILSYTIPKKMYNEIKNRFEKEYGK